MTDPKFKEPPKLFCPECGKQDFRYNGTGYWQGDSAESLICTGCGMKGIGRVVEKDVDPDWMKL